MINTDLFPEQAWCEGCLFYDKLRTITLFFSNLQSIEIVNEGNVEPDWTVGSLYVAALYLSLNIPTCANVISDKLFQ